MSKAVIATHARSASVPPNPAPRPPPAAAAAVTARDLFDSPCMRPEASPTRMEAVLLKDAYEEMLANSRAQHAGQDPLALAAAAARRADAAGLLRCLEPEMYILDVTLNELVNQVRVGCQERGALLNTCRARLMQMFSAASAGVGELSARRDDQAKQVDALRDRVRELEAALEAAARRADEIEAAVSAGAAEVAALLQDAAADAARRASGRPSTAETREQGLAARLAAAEEMRGVFLSKIHVLKAEADRGGAVQGVMRCQVEQLQERIRRDAERFDLLSEALARARLSAFWLRAIAFARRAPRSRREAATQDGDGMGTGVAAAEPDRLETPPEERRRRELEALKARVVTREMFVGKVTRTAS
jgi:hypothetical protein